MDYFMKRENVEQYKKMIDGYDGIWLIRKLDKYLEKGKSILELGMGTGIDYELLSKKYNVLGTDNSPIFINDYIKNNPKGNVQILDATNINLNKLFDCVYSNKVLHHLTMEDFKKSLIEQHRVLDDKGKIFMTLWYGKYEEKIFLNGEMRFTLYEEQDIENIISDSFNIISMERYTELEEKDSLLVVLEKINDVK